MESASARAYFDVRLLLGKANSRFWLEEDDIFEGEEDRDGIPEREMFQKDWYKWKYKKK